MGTYLFYLSSVSILFAAMAAVADLYCYLFN